MNSIRIVESAFVRTVEDSRPNTVFTAKIGAPYAETRSTALIARTMKTFRKGGIEMPCHPIFNKGKLEGWACTIGREQRTPPPCYKCGRPSTRLCDHRCMERRYQTDEYGNKLRKVWIPHLGTCDRPMCDECANHIEPDTDYCDFHNNEFDIKMSMKAEKLYQKMLEEEGDE